jgi:hypothetical protein
MVRCPGCGASQSEWALHCARCGGDLTAAPLIGPQRRHRPSPRRLLVLTTAAVVAIVAITVAPTSGHPQRSRGRALPPIAAPHPGALGIPVMVVAVDAEGKLVGHDLRTGASSVRARDAAAWPEGPVTVADHSFYISGGELFTPAGRAPLAAADRLVAVSNLEELWTAALPAGAAGLVSLFVAQPAWGRVGTVRLAPGEVPVAADAGHLVSVRGAAIVVRDANSGRVLATTGPVAHDYDVVGAYNGTVVFARTGGCLTGCPLDLVDVTSGAVTSLASPVGTFGFLGGGAISISGEIAAFVSTGTPPVQGADVVLVDDARTEKIMRVPVDVEEPVASAAWDPTGRWLVFGGLRATYVLDTSTMRTTLLPFVAGYGFSLLAS